MNPTIRRGLRSSLVAAALLSVLPGSSAHAARVHESLTLLAAPAAKSARVVPESKSASSAPVVPGLPPATAPADATLPSPVGPDGRVQVVAVAAGAASTAVADLTALGATGIAVAGNLINARLPLTAVPATAGLRSITDIAVDDPSTRVRNVGAVDSQGDGALGGGAVRAALGTDGRGVKVCAVSDSYDTARFATQQPATDAADDIATGDLPGAGNPAGRTTPVDVVLEGPSASSDEGRAMLQIVHDLAPGASLGFGSAFAGGKATGVQMRENLVARGCGVIVDDTNNFGSPFLRDGIVAAKIDELVGRGVHYVISAGNQGRSGYGSRVGAGAVRTLVAFNGNVLGDYELINFNPDPNGPADFHQAIDVAGGFRPFFQWNDRFLSEGEAGGATTEIDLFVTVSDGRFDRILFASVGRASGSPLVSIEGIFGGQPALFVSGVAGGNRGNDPLEQFITRVLTPDRTQLLAEFSGLPNFGNLRWQLIAGRRVDAGGTAPTHVRWVDVNRVARNIEFGTVQTTSTSVAQVQAARAITVAASRYDTPLLVRDFSSRGLTTLFFDPAGNLLPTPIARRKPELTGPDGADTTFFLPGNDTDGTGFPNFPGTSASAPHVAGLAALLLSATGSQPTPDTLRAFLQATATDLDDPDTAGFDAGFDARTGTGFVDGPAVATAVTTDRASVRFTVPAGALVGNGRPYALEAGSSIARVTVSGYGSATLTQRDERARYVVDPAPLSLSPFLPERSVFVNANGRSTDGSTFASNTQNLRVTNLGFVAPAAGTALRAGTPVALAVAAHESVARVEYALGTQSLGGSSNAEDGFRVQASLPAGTQTVVATARNASGAAVYTRSLTVVVSP